ncbi:MAG: mechanosensitive ion channel [Prevotella sp.]|jgi:small conductance mechanosensitive channel|nr:mechanosensitive ion channel [Prevotella sp.]
MLEKILSPETYSLLGQWALSFCKNLIIAIIVYLVGRWIIKWINKLTKKALKKSNVDPSLYTFLKSIVSVVLWLVLIIIIISILGIETSSFIALFASAGVAIGMALSGTLQNFAGGVMILLFKPFKVGDFIEAKGFMGTVKEIQIFNTIISTIDNQMVIIPNGGLATEAMKNYTAEKYRRVDLDYTFAYGTDLDKVKAAINEVQAQNPLIMQGPADDSPVVAAPWVGITEFGEKGVIVNTRTWCKTEDYWTVYFYMNETVYQQLKDRGFMFPVGRMNVNIQEKK